jgi:hypothetical protein
MKTAFLVQFLFFSTFLFSCKEVQTNSSSQTGDVQFSITRASLQDQNLINFEAKLINSTENSIKLYKPSLFDVCYGILHFKLVDDFNHEYIYDPCDQDAQLDHIELTLKNSVLLNPNDECQLKYLLKVDSFHLRKTINSNWMIVCIIDYPAAEYNGAQNIFKDRISSKSQISFR